MQKKYLGYCLFISITTQTLYASPSIEDRLALLSKAFSSSSIGGGGGGFNIQNPSSPQREKEGIQTMFTAQEMKPDISASTPAQEMKPDISASTPAQEMKPDISASTPAQEMKPDISASTPDQEMKPDISASTPDQEMKPDISASTATQDVDLGLQNAGSESRHTENVTPSESRKEEIGQITNTKQTVQHISEVAKETGRQLVNYFTPTFQELFSMIGQKLISWGKNENSHGTQDVSPSVISNSIPSNSQSITTDTERNVEALSVVPEKEAISISTENYGGSNALSPNEQSISGVAHARELNPEKEQGPL